jgi:hypothetical protein
MFHYVEKHLTIRMTLGVLEVEIMREMTPIVLDGLEAAGASGMNRTKGKC